MFFISWNKHVFFSVFFLYPEINCFFSEIGNNPMRALGRKKNMFARLSPIIAWSIPKVLWGVNIIKDQLLNKNTMLGA